MNNGNNSLTEFLGATLSRRAGTNTAKLLFALRPVVDLIKALQS